MREREGGREREKTCSGGLGCADGNSGGAQPATATALGGQQRREEACERILALGREVVEDGKRDKPPCARKRLPCNQGQRGLALRLGEKRPRRLTGRNWHISRTYSSRRLKANVANPRRCVTLRRWARQRVIWAQGL